MIEQFEAVSYKSLQNFRVGPLQKVNLIAGPNGVGKTSLGEALWLFKGKVQSRASLEPARPKKTYRCAESTQRTRGQSPSPRL